MSWLRKRLVLLVSIVAVMALVVAACNGDDDADDVADDVDDTVTEVVDDDDDVVEEDDEVVEEDDEVVEEDDEVVEEDDEVDDVAENGIGEGQTIEIAYIEWDEGVAVTYLWIQLLEEQGFEVELTLADAGPIYTDLSEGGTDLFLDAWLPATHAEYWDQFGDDIEQIATWYDEGVLALTVPQYVVDEHGVESLEDLADNADLFDSTITGIEPGAGMMGIAAETVMPEYGLDDWTLVEASTPAMLTELETAIENEEPIVVTLWEPHWAYAAWDLHNLDDPAGAWGEPDSLQIIARSGFSEDFPEVAEWMADFNLSAEEIGELMDYVTVQAEDGEEQEYALQWLEDGGRDVVPSLN